MAEKIDTIISIIRIVRDRDSNALLRRHIHMKSFLDRFFQKGFAPILLSGSSHGLGSAVLSVHCQTRVLLAAPLRA